MPIYAYRCDACGHAQDVLQKISDAPLTVCTSCGAPAFTKQVTAAGFQLKGSGWYATDFKNGSGKKSDGDKARTKPDIKSDTKPDTKTDSKPDTATAGAKPSTEAAPAAPACGAGGCAACS